MNLQNELEKDITEGRISKAVVMQLLSELFCLRNPKYLADDELFISENSEAIIQDKDFFNGFLLGIATIVATVGMPDHVNVGKAAEFFYATLRDGMLSHYKDEFTQTTETKNEQSDSKGTSSGKNASGETLH